MNKLLRRKIGLVLGVALLGLSGTVLACLPNNCQALYEACMANGGPRCAVNHANCLRSFGCPIP